MNLNQTSDTPVLIIGFSRTENIFKQIEKLRSFGVRKIFLSLDYSTNTYVQEFQNELITRIRALPLKSSERIEIWHKSWNHGIAANVISSLDWFFHFNSRGIVLEDDLDFELDFIQFCSAGLQSYSEQRDVLMISGNRYDAVFPSAQVAITRFPQIWGWATWRDRWLEMRNMIMREKKFKIHFLISPSKSFFFSGARRVSMGYIDTWDLPLAFEMLSKERFCILPPVNLVTNSGADSFAVHTLSEDFPMKYPISKLKECKFVECTELRKTLAKTDYFLEKHVFSVKTRHVLSPIKLLLESWFLNSKRQKYQELTVRLDRVEKYEL